MTDTDQDLSGQPISASLSEPMRAVFDALKTLRFGAIQLTVHDGKLVQIDITERKRFSN